MEGTVYEDRVCYILSTSQSNTQLIEACHKIFSKMLFSRKKTDPFATHKKRFANAVQLDSSSLVVFLSKNATNPSFSAGAN